MSASDAHALRGHAGAVAPQWLTRPAVFLHICGILFWFGALLPLWLLLRDPGETVSKALASFSRWIPYAVGPLALSGVTLAVIQMGHPSPQWLSPYGFILAAKVGLLVALFEFALWNRLWRTAPALAGEAVACRLPRQSIALEMGIVIIILGLAAGWRFSRRRPEPWSWHQSRPSWPSLSQFISCMLRRWRW